ncbi:MAG: hypothetical protein O7H39_10420 [Gammaproteobacteria bacterium]|nr:hypothetical protein [Gammaproteobacteria bacterium]
MIAAFNGVQAPGLAIHTVGTPVRILLAELDSTAFEPVVVGVRPGTPELSARSVLTTHGFSVAVGSGFVSEFRPISPLGLLQTDGVLVNELSIHGYTRIVGVRDHHLTVVGRRDYAREMFDSALQVGPGIVENGVLDISERELGLPAYFRAFIATCEGRTLVGISLEPMHLYDVGRDFLAFARAAHLRCGEVVNLSGDREAVLTAQNPDAATFVHFGYPDLARASLIGFRRRAQRPAQP